jgi:MFS family permease
MRFDSLLACAMIGAAASLAGMIWPFRRGALGVAVNLLIGIGGALAGGLLSYLVLPLGAHGDTPARLLFAALAALAALGLAHAIWTHEAAQRRAREARPSSARTSDTRRSGERAL